MNFNTAHNRFTFYGLRVCGLGLWFWHGFFVLFVVVKKEFFALLCLWKVLILLKFILCKNYQVRVFVRKFWWLKICIFHIKGIWKLHYLVDYIVVAKRRVLSQIALLFCIGFSFLFSLFTLTLIIEVLFKCFVLMKCSICQILNQPKFIFRVDRYFRKL